jgi:hypothetical protein
MNWTCPHCYRPQVVTSNNQSVGKHNIRIGYDGGNLEGFRSEAIACLNGDCRKMTLFGSLHNRSDDAPDRYINPPTRTWRLLPDSAAKPQPEYIKAVLREDYYEASRFGI